MAKKAKELTPEEKALLEKAKQEGEDARLEFHIFRCSTCAHEPEFVDSKLFMGHLEFIHQVPVKTAKFKRQETMHLDGTKYYQTSYACQIEGMAVTFSEHIRTKRTAEDMLYWMDV